MRWNGTPGALLVPTAYYLLGKNKIQWRRRAPKSILMKNQLFVYILLIILRLVKEVQIQLFVYIFSQN